MDDQRPEEILFRDPDTALDYKVLAIPNAADGQPGQAAIISSDTSGTVIHPYAELELDTTQAQGRFALRVYEKVKTSAGDHKIVTFTLATVVTGVAIGIAALRRKKG